MIITDMNKMSMEELVAIHSRLGIVLEINDGKIVSSFYEKSTVTDGKSEQC